jgi:hypothetical protein
MVPQRVARRIEACGREVSEPCGFELVQIDLHDQDGGTTERVFNLLRQRVRSGVAAWREPNRYTVFVAEEACQKIP